MSAAVDALQFRLQLRCAHSGFARPLPVAVFDVTPGVIHARQGHLHVTLQDRSVLIAADFDLSVEQMPFAVIEGKFYFSRGLELGRELQQNLAFVIFRSGIGNFNLSLGIGLASSNFSLSKRTSSVGRNDGVGLMVPEPVREPSSSVFSSVKTPSLRYG